MGTTVAPTAAKRPQLYPFAMGTRRRIQTVGSFTFTPGTPVPTITLPQVGFLSKIYLKLEGTITQTAAGATLSPLGLAALLSRVRVNANLGSAAIVDVSGPGLELLNYMHAPTAGPVKAAYGNAIAANPVSYGAMIPINANDRTLLQLGLINLQAEQVRVTLDVIPAAVTAYLTAGGGTITPALTLYVAYEYWDVPNPSRYQLPPATIVRSLEESFAITATGDQTYVIPRLGTLAQVAEYFIIAGAMGSLVAPTPQVSKFRLRANKTDTWLEYDTRFAEIEEAIFANNTLSSFTRPGTRIWDFFHSGQQTRNFGDRDLINTEAITTLELIATVDPTVVPGANSSRSIVRRVFQALV